MSATTDFDVIIVCGSYAGLSAAMTLGRSLRKVLVLDSGQPCNRQTPHSHNFITQDGEPPSAISQKAKVQVLAYPGVVFKSVKAVKALKQGDGFKVEAESKESFTSRRLLFATGLSDIMPAVKGFQECWGKSLLHCPYCHGYEVHGKELGVIANGEIGFEFTRMISNWTKKLTLFTNGVSTLSPEQEEKLKKHTITVVEKEIEFIDHKEGQIRQLVFKDGTTQSLTAAFTKPPFRQQCSLPEELECEFTESRLLKVDDFQKTSVDGVYAAGDNSSLFRAVSAAVASGTKAGAMINRGLIVESF